MHSHVFDDTLLNKQQIKEIINGKIKKKVSWDKQSGNTVCQNLCGAEKSVLREKFITISAYIKKQRSQIHNPTLHLQELGKEQAELKVRQRK